MVLTSDGVWLPASAGRWALLPNVVELDDEKVTAKVSVSEAPEEAEARANASKYQFAHLSFQESFFAEALVQEHAQRHSHWMRH